MKPYWILYRGSLSSCNYSCEYCPFAKTKNTKEELKQDERQLHRFADWVAGVARPVGILMTPWGEAIVHSYYRRTLSRLSRLPHVSRVAIQTNISSPIDDLLDADRDALALWATYHPGQVRQSVFLKRCANLLDHGIRFSVGVVGLKEHLADILELRKALDPSIYVWVNAFKRVSDYYSDSDVQILKSVDPYFGWNRHYYESQGRPCNAGSSSFTVDGLGDVRRCHFVDRRIGNIYTDDIFQKLNPSFCPNATCGCHIGYVHRPELKLHDLFGANLMERIPASWPEVQADFAR